MPGLDGFETCRRLKADPRSRDLPVIFMTSLSEPNKKVRAFAAGAVDSIVKPVYPPKVLARVSVHLQILEEKSPVTPALLLRLGLTQREAEVFFGIAQGKSNPDIATILAVGVRTVHKHVEPISEKFGCDTLTAADVLRSTS